MEEGYANLCNDSEVDSLPFYHKLKLLANSQSIKLYICYINKNRYASVEQKKAGIMARKQIKEGYLSVLNQAVPTTSRDFTLLQRRQLGSNAYPTVTFKSPEDVAALSIMLSFSFCLLSLLLCLILCIFLLLLSQLSLNNLLPQVLELIKLCNWFSLNRVLNRFL